MARKRQQDASNAAPPATLENGGIGYLLHRARLWPAIWALGIGFAIILLVLVGILTIPLELAPSIGLLLAASLLVVAGLLLAVYRLRTQILLPLIRLRRSVDRVSQGESAAVLPQEDTGVLDDLVQDIGSIADELTDLYEDMDNRVARHTTRLAQKTASLKILYDVAASINQAQDLDELLIRFLRILKEMVNGLAATVRVVQPDGHMRLVGSIGLNNEVVKEQDLLPLELCLCGATLSSGDILCEHKGRHCSKQLGRQMFGSDEVEVVTVPLAYHDDTLGLYNVFVRRPGISEREDIIELLRTIGNHLGMAVAKQRSDEEARRLSIVEERTALSHELHDSLAQTLASLRLQVRMLQDTLQQDGSSPAADEDLARIRNGVDEAYGELRELLHSFRAPAEQRGLINTLDRQVKRFASETGVASYFQNECGQLNLSSSEEVQIMRIVGEALANIRKHARAHTVRVLVSCRNDGSYVVLIEDDGVGFEQTRRSGHPGEHIGLSIMEERARKLGGELRIDSEPGEGTQVELYYKPASKFQDAPKQWVM